MRWFALALCAVVTCGCAGSTRYVKIQPSEWEAVTNRTYEVPRDTVYNAILSYLQAAGTITMAEKESGLIKGQVHPSVPGGLQFMEPSLRVSQEQAFLLSDSSGKTKVTLKITGTASSADVREVTGTVDNATAYTQAFEGIERILHPPKHVPTP